MPGKQKRILLSAPEFKKKNYDISARIAIVKSSWNSEITGRLLKGAIKTLQENGISEKKIFIFEVPGSFELPLAASWCLRKKKADAVICLGCLIKGETPHFDYIASAVAHGITQVGLQYEKPVVFGVLTTHTWEQAEERAGGKHGNKGTEAALTCLEMLDLKEKIK